MVCSVKIVVDRFRHAHNTAFVPDMLHVLADLVASIHRIVSAVVEKVTDVVFLEDFENLLIIRFVFFVIL